MNDAEIRVRCIEAAAEVRGNPNTIQLAREFYEFVLENQTPAMAEVIIEGAADVDGKIIETTVMPPKGLKGSRK